MSETTGRSRVPPPLPNVLERQLALWSSPGIVDTGLGQVNRVSQPTCGSQRQKQEEKTPCGYGDRDPPFPPTVSERIHPECTYANGHDIHEYGEQPPTPSYLLQSAHCALLSSCQLNRGRASQAVIPGEGGPPSSSRPVPP